MCASCSILSAGYSSFVEIIFRQASLVLHNVIEDKEGVGMKKLILRIYNHKTHMKSKKIHEWRKRLDQNVSSSRSNSVMLKRATKQKVR